MPSLFQRTYYVAKPWMPWRLRNAVRGAIVRRKLDRVLNMWPILPGSEKPPVNWPGWPNKKKFALVLTHDVEGRRGLENCRALMEMEMALGFRSSFNFVPEGEYRPSPGLRVELVRNGFEIGVHDLRHDGKLYRSRADFIDKSRRINRYLREWDAVGFRSAFMLHKLDWLHDLDILYDASTFDTDPFEPQPDGVGTIFPFWVPLPDHELRTTDRRPRAADLSVGYAELPYTLAQDSTLFLLFRETSPQIWLRKLDWVAEHGGMALLNVHPDYMRFSGESSSPSTFSWEHYRQLLEYARDRYDGAYWHPLPMELARFVASVRPEYTVRKPKRVCMLSHSFYELDGRVIRYAEALAQRGDEVDVFALRRSSNLNKEDIMGGVHVFRLQDRFGKRERSRFSYILPLMEFFLRSSIRIMWRHILRRYDLIHVHNVPDFLIFAAWFPKLTGAKVILDIHDIVPEFYASKFGTSTSAPAIRALQVVERLSARFADHVIMSNHLWLERYTARTKCAGKCSVFINNVNSDVFYPRRCSREDGRFIILFPGGLQWHQGLDIAIQAFKRVSQEEGHAEFHIYGDGNMKPRLIDLVTELELDKRVRFFDPVGLRDIASVMADADLGVVPKRADSFGNEAYSTKIMEFMSVGVPVVVSGTRIDRYYFDDSVVRFFESGNAEAMAEAILEVMRNSDLRGRMVQNALAYAACHSWASRKIDYLNLSDSLLSGDGAPVGVDDHCFPGDAGGGPPAHQEGSPSRPVSSESAPETSPVSLHGG